LVYTAHPIPYIDIPMNFLQADSIQKSFGNRKVLSDVHIQCNEGEIVGLLGRNGSGKSTLMKILHGSLQADQKYIKVNNEVLLSTEQLSQQIAYLPQDPFIPLHLKCKQIFPYIDEAYLNPTLLQQEDLKIKNLSGGLLRCLEIYFVLSRPCPYLLLDEPFTGCSPILIEELQQKILHASRQKKGIILSDHLYKEVQKITQRNYLMKEGILKESSNLDGYAPTF
jgi:lipopolysaccharide export system ATP-binding protein